jgi:hypothetical protein
MDRIHYSMRSDVGGELWDGQTPCPPRVGEIVIIEGERYVVTRLEWETAGAAMGAEAARSWGHGAGDHAFVSITCARAPL